MHIYACRFCTYIYLSLHILVLTSFRLFMIYIISICTSLPLRCQPPAIAVSTAACAVSTAVHVAHESMHAHASRLPQSTAVSFGCQHAPSAPALRALVGAMMLLNACRCKKRRFHFALRARTHRKTLCGVYRPKSMHNFKYVSVARVQISVHARNLLRDDENFGRRTVSDLLNVQRAFGYSVAPFQYGLATFPGHLPMHDSFVVNAVSTAEMWGAHIYIYQDHIYIYIYIYAYSCLAVSTAAFMDPRAPVACA
jgi:hypothetical protein